MLTSDPRPAALPAALRRRQCTPLRKTNYCRRNRPGRSRRSPQPTPNLRRGRSNRLCSRTVRQHLGTPNRPTCTPQPSTRALVRNLPSGLRPLCNWSWSARLLPAVRGCIARPLGRPTQSRSRCPSCFRSHSQPASHAAVPGTRSTPALGETVGPIPTTSSSPRRNSRRAQRAFGLAAAGTPWRRDAVAGGVAIIAGATRLRFCRNSANESRRHRERQTRQ